MLSAPNSVVLLTTCESEQSSKRLLMEIGTTESKTELKEATDGDRYNRQ